LEVDAMNREDCSEQLGMMVKELGLETVLHLLANGVKYLGSNEENADKADALDDLAENLDAVLATYEERVDEINAE
jgi:hypothetical protein